MNGVLVVNKEGGFTSFDVVAILRGLTKERKIGHTGTLDPMATGVLPLLLGRAAKAADLLPDTEKEYEAVFAFGEKFDTGDCTGACVCRDSTPVSREALEAALPRFQGDIFQIPPMYSAVSVGGKRLYELARKGLEVEREPRKIHISALELTGYEEKSRTGSLRIACSKGTYIRTLIEDLAAACGTVGTMTALERTRACGFSLEEARSLPQLRELAEEDGLKGLLRPVDSLFQEYAPVMVSPGQATRFLNGGSLDMDRVRLPRMAFGEGDRLRIYGPDNVFLGLCTISPERGELKFLKLFWEKEGEG